VRQPYCIIAIFLIVMALVAQDFQISGVIVDAGTEIPIENAKLRLVGHGIAYTDADGTFEIRNGVSNVVLGTKRENETTMRIRSYPGGGIRVVSDAAANAKVTLSDLRGRTIAETLEKSDAVNFAFASKAIGLYVIHITGPGIQVTRKLVSAPTAIGMSYSVSVPVMSEIGSAARKETNPGELIVSAAGYALKNISLPTIIDTTLYITLDAIDGPRKVISLNGVWGLQEGDENAAPDSCTRTVSVPGIAKSAVPAFADDLDFVEQSWEYVWYRKTFVLSHADYSRAILSLRARYNAKVYLNGVEIGYDHYCTYSHGEFDLTDAINFSGENELEVRVGAWQTASSPSKETSAHHWRTSRCPGIWDDVTLELFRKVRIRDVYVRPELRDNMVMAEVILENFSDQNVELVLKTVIVDPANGSTHSDESSKAVSIEPGDTLSADIALLVDDITEWTAGKEGTPKVYDFRTELFAGVDQKIDSLASPFGYRSIGIEEKYLLINGVPSFLRAGNVVFNRALIDWPEILFDAEWIRKFMVFLKEYNYNFIRSHIGHMPQRWYDIADEVGIMIQDEWIYFHDSDPQGAEREEAKTEWRRWIRANYNHPSIIIWDEENEGGVQLKELVAELKAFDPTRPWASDMSAVHSYEYAEQKGVNSFSNPPHNKPKTILESCRFWLGQQGEPDVKAVKKIDQWFGKEAEPTVKELYQFQADMQSDVGGYHRSRRFSGWAPFVIISSHMNGGTFFLGDIGDSLSPKPCMSDVLFHLNEKLGATIEMYNCMEWQLWDSTYTPGVDYKKSVYVWNDFYEAKTATLVCTACEEKTGEVVSKQTFNVNVPRLEAIEQEVTFTMPGQESIAVLQCELLQNGEHVAWSPARRLRVR